MILDRTLDLKIHQQSVYNWVNKTILLLCKLQSTLPRIFLIDIYKLFLRHHLNYGDKNYVQACSNSFQKKPELVQYNGSLAIPAIRTCISSKNGFVEKTLSVS